MHQSEMARNIVFKLTCSVLGYEVLSGAWGNSQCCSSVIITCLWQYFAAWWIVFKYILCTVVAADQVEIREHCSAKDATDLVKW